MPSAVFTERRVRVGFTLCLFLEGKKLKQGAVRHISALSRANGTLGVFAAEWGPKLSPLKIHSLLPSPILLHFLLTHSHCVFYTHRYFSLYLHAYAHVSPPYIITPFSFVLVYILYAAYSNADAVYVCIHCMPVCVSIVWPTYLCSIHLSFTDTVVIIQLASFIIAYSFSAVRIVQLYSAVSWSMFLSSPAPPTLPHPTHDRSSSYEPPFRIVEKKCPPPPRSGVNYDIKKMRGGGVWGRVGQ